VIGPLRQLGAYPPRARNYPADLARRSIAPLVSTPPREHSSRSARPPASAQPRGADQAAVFGRECLTRMVATRIVPGAAFV